MLQPLHLLPNSVAALHLKLFAEAVCSMFLLTRCHCAPTFVVDCRKTTHDTNGSLHSLVSACTQCAAEMLLQDDAAMAPPGPLYLPDAAGVLAPTTSLFFNDAPWLEDTGARLVHESVRNAVAEALHVQSLRFHHEVRDDCHPHLLSRAALQAVAAVMCPSV